MKSQQEIDKKFLYRENKQLRVELKQAKQLVKIHKDAVLRLSQPFINDKTVIAILLDLISASMQTKKIDQLNQKILGLESQQMVLQKIVEQTDNDEKQTYHILAEQYNKIKQDNERLQKQLHKFYEKIGEVDYLSGLVTKYKEVIIPSQQAVAFKKQQEQLLEFIGLQKSAIRKLTEQKNKLLRINILMKQSVQKHKDEVRNMTMILTNPDMLMNISMQNDVQSPKQNEELNILDELNEGEEAKNGHNKNEDANNSKNQNAQRVNPYNLNNSLINMTTNGNNSMLNMSSNRGLSTTMNFIRMQRKIIKEEDQEAIGQSDHESEGEYQCPQLNILFPDKVQKIKKDKEITKVPYLNMMKIRQLMAKRDTKIRKEIEADARHVNPTDKIIKLETELEITRKELTNQTLKFRNMSEQIKQALKLNEELEYRNQLLMTANERLQTNYRNVYKDYQFTKIIALRVEKALANKIQESQNTIEEINTSKDLDDKIMSVQHLLRKVYGKKITPARSQSVDK